MLLAVPFIEIGGKQKIPKPFFTHFLREKPWGRGCMSHHKFYHSPRLIGPWRADRVRS